VSGKRAKQLRRATKKILRESGMTPKNIRLIVMAHIRPKPWYLPTWWWLARINRVFEADEIMPANWREQIRLRPKIEKMSRKAEKQGKKDAEKQRVFKHGVEQGKVPEV
jgi:hypothetical protein